MRKTRRMPAGGRSVGIDAAGDRMRVAGRDVIEEHHHHYEANAAQCDDCRARRERELEQRDRRVWILLRALERRHRVADHARVAIAAAVALSLTMSAWQLEDATVSTALGAGAWSAWLATAGCGAVTWWRWRR